MGSFAGHAPPGIVLGLFALHWSWEIFQRYFMCQRENRGAANCAFPVKFRCDALYSSNCCGRKVPIMSFGLVLASIAGLVAEFLSLYANEADLTLSVAQHMTMYFFFGIPGVISIFKFYNYRMLPGLSYVTIILAFGMEAYLFGQRSLHYKTPMDTQVHMFIVYAAVGCAVSTAIEMICKDSVLAGLARCFFTLLQGTWFFQISFILFPPFWKSDWVQDDQNQMMIVSLMFAWHVAGVFIFMCILGTVVQCRVNSMDSELVHRSLNGYFSLSTPVAKNKCDSVLTCKGLMEDCNDGSTY